MERKKIGIICLVVLFVIAAEIFSTNGHLVEAQESRENAQSECTCMLLLVAFEETVPQTVVLKNGAADIYFPLYDVWLKCSAQTHDDILHEWYVSEDQVIWQKLEYGYLRVYKTGTVYVMGRSYMEGHEVTTEVKRGIEIIERKSLENLIGKCREISAGGYTGETYKAFLGALEQAEDIVYDGEISQEEAEKAEQDLQEAVDKLKTILDAEKEQLELLLKETELYVKEDYTKETWSRLESAIENARKVMEMEKTSTEEVKDAQMLLRIARENLIRQNAEEQKIQSTQPTEDLNEMKIQGQNLLEQEASRWRRGQGVYTDASWESFAKAYQNLQNAVRDGNNLEISRLCLEVKQRTKNLKEISKITIKIDYAKRTGYRRAKLSWKKKKGAKGYLIYRSTKKHREYRFCGSVKKNSYTDKNIKPGKTYYYKIVPYVSSNKHAYGLKYKGYSNKATTGQLRALVDQSGYGKKLVVKKLSALKMKKSQDRLVLSWDSTNGLQHARIEYRKDEEKKWKLSGIRNPGVTSGTVRIPPSKYWYRVVYVWKDGKKLVTKARAFG